MIFDKIFRQRKNAFWICLALAMIFMLSAVPGNSSYAQGRIMREEWKVPDFYPKGFDGYGKIERIDQGGVVIDDTALKFSRQVRFATPKDRSAGLYAFSVGDTVGYLLNEKREIISLWYIKFRNR
ncbi:MAG: hypothetical protein PVH28_05865 [Desulfobacterales bacterium]|jgi:hypothetical protein